MHASNDDIQMLESIKEHLEDYKRLNKRIIEFGFEDRLEYLIDRCYKDIAKRNAYRIMRKHKTTN